MLVLYLNLQISKYLKWLLPSIYNSWFNFVLSHTLMILDGQILIMLKYPVTVLKTIVHNHCLYANHCLASFTKLPSYCQISLVENK